MESDYDRVNNVLRIKSGSSSRINGKCCTPDQKLVRSRQNRLASGGLDLCAYEVNGKFERITDAFRSCAFLQYEASFPEEANSKCPQFSSCISFLSRNFKGLGFS